MEMIVVFVDEIKSGNDVMTRIVNDDSGRPVEVHDFVGGIACFLSYGTDGVPKYTYEDIEPLPTKRLRPAPSSDLLLRASDLSWDLMLAEVS